MATTLIKEIHQKGSTGSTAIGVNGENVKLDTAQPNPGTIINASAALNASNAIYYNNTQAEMYRKGIQIENLNSSMSNLTGATANYITTNMVNGTPSTDENGNKILTQNSDIQIQDNKVILTGDDSTGSKKAIIEGTSAPNTAAISSLAAAIPYMVQVDPASGSSTVQSYNSINSNDFFIKGQDGLQNIGKKFNAFYQRMTTSTNTMTDAELINKYGIDHQGEHYIIQNSKIQSSLGWPSTTSATKLNLDGGHMRYRVYQGEAVIEKAPSAGIPAKNTDIHFGPNTIYKSYIAKSYTVSSTSRLYDIDQLPTAPRGYKWKCIYVRGTYPYPNMTEENIITTDSEYYMLWEKLDGYSTVNGYLNNGWELSFDLPVYNLYKGTNFDNLVRAEMSKDIWQAINLTNSTKGFDSTNKYSFASAAGSTYGGVHGYLSNLPSMKAILWGNNSTEKKYLYQRPIYYQRRVDFDDYTNLMITKVGSRFSPQEKLRYSLAAQSGTKDGKTFWDYFHNYIDNTWQGNGPAVLSLKDWPISLVFKKPFMYAEYILVPVTTKVYTDEWYNLNPTDEYHGDDEDSGGTDPENNS